MATPTTPVAEMTDAELIQAMAATKANPIRLRAVQAEALRRLPVRPLVGGGYVVRSRTTAGAWWLVEGWSAIGESPCSCPANTHRCWHVRQVEAWCRLQDRMARRDTPPPNVSALVD
jgi:hypothetical protein